MADHPCDLGPPLVVALDPEEVDVEVQVGLQVLGVHAGEAPEAALELRAQVAHQPHRLQVLRVPRVRLVGLARKTVLPDEDVMGPLAVVDERDTVNVFFTNGTAVGILDRIHPMPLGPNPCDTAWGSCNPGRPLS